MGKKLEHKPERGVFRQYREPGEFRDDMRQIWTNCRLYNAVGTPVRGMVRARAAAACWLASAVVRLRRCSGGSRVPPCDVRGPCACVE